MVVMFSSGGELDEICDTGISNSMVPTLCGPRYCGRDGNGFKDDNMVVRPKMANGLVMEIMFANFWSDTNAKNENMLSMYADLCVRRRG